MKSSKLTVIKIASTSSTGALSKILVEVTEAAVDYFDSIIKVIFAQTKTCINIFDRL